VTRLCVTSGHRSISWERVSRCDWRVHHVGRRAVRFVAADSVVATITAPGVGLSPIGVQVATAPDFAAVTQVALRTTGPITLVADVDAVDLRLAAASTTVAALAALRDPLETWADGLDAEHARLHALGAQLSHALAADAPVDGLVLALVGAGPGATPAGDDVLVGLMAALVRSGQSHAARRLSSAVRPLLHRTTAVSRTLLVAAGEQEFAGYVHTLAHAAADARLVPDALRELAAVGATSGFDTALGFCSSSSLRHRRRSAA